MDMDDAARSSGAGDASRPVTVTIKRFARLVWTLTTVVYSLGVIHAVVVVLMRTEPDGPKIRLFNLDGEADLPAWFSSSLLLGAALIVLLISARSASDRGRWRVLAGVFAVLSLDEAGRVHEAISAVMGHSSEFGGVFYYSWVLVGLAVVIMLGIYFLPFVTRLREDTRWRVILAGALYVGGALGMEMVGGSLLGGGVSQVWVWVGVVVEEGLEMCGAAVFIITMARHLSLISPETLVRLMPPVR